MTNTGSSAPSPLRLLVSPASSPVSLRDEVFGVLAAAVPDTIMWSDDEGAFLVFGSLLEALDASLALQPFGTAVAVSRVELV